MLLVIFAASKAIGYNGVIAAQPVSDFLTAVLAVVLFKKQLGDFLNRNLYWLNKCIYFIIN